MLTLLLQCAELSHPEEFQVIIGLILLKLLELCKKTASPHYSWKLHHPGGYKQFFKFPNALAGWEANF